MFEIGSGSGPSPAAVAALDGVDPTGLSDYDLVELIVACQQVISWASAVQARGVSTLAARQLSVLPDDHPTGISPPAVGGVDEHAIDELAAALRYSGRQAGRLVGFGVGLSRLPATATALHDGRLDVSCARVLVDATADLPTGLARQVETAVLDAATRVTPGQLAARVARTITRLAPDQVHTRRQAARADRRVAVYPDPATGTAELTATGLDPVDSQAIWTRLTALAHTLDGTSDPRPLDARRLDAFVALLTGTPWPTPTPGQPAPGQPGHTGRPGSTSGGTPPTPAGSRDGLPRPGGPGGPGGPTLVVHLTVTADTLTGDEPAWLTGYGPLTAHQTRQLLATRHIHPTITVLDPATGAPTATSPPTCPTRTCHNHPPDGDPPDDDPPDGDPPDEAAPDDDGDPPDGGGPPRRGPRTPTPPPPSAGYRPGPALTRLIHTRDQTCRFPTCRTNATHADLDHLLPWPDGPTTPANLWVLCRHHHQLKHSGTWQVTPHTPAGTNGPVTWTSPTGHTYPSLPARQ